MANLAEADEAETESADAIEAWARFAKTKETDCDTAEDVAERTLDAEADEAGLAEVDIADDIDERRLDAGGKAAAADCELK